jgi:hypothetical protein
MGDVLLRVQGFHLSQSVFTLLQWFLDSRTSKFLKKPPYFLMIKTNPVTSLYKVLPLY